jgi:hypothetical protein
MPSENRFLVALRGTDQYARYLDRLAKRLAGDGVQIDNHHRLAEYALTVLGLRYGLKAPRRMPPIGTRKKVDPEDADDA